MAKKTKKKKEEEFKIIDINDFTKIEFIVSIFIGTIFLVMLALSITNEVFIPAALISLAMFLFCISYYYMEDERMKKISYTLYAIGILLIISEVIYTIVRII